MSDLQRTEEWYQARLGKVTASRVADVIAKTKSGYSASRANYMAELVAERLTGKKSEHYVNEAMQWGTDHEADAKAAYEFFRGETVVPVGFVQHPAITDSGASPDGLVGPDGLIEVKCPNTARHIETMISGEIQSKYLTQMMWQMICTGRKWCDFVSFDPRLPAKHQLFVKRVVYDSAEANRLMIEVSQFLFELEVMIEALEQREVAA